MRTIVSCLLFLAFLGVHGNKPPVTSATLEPRSFFVTKAKGDYASVKSQCINEGGSIASIRSEQEDNDAKALCATKSGGAPCLMGLTDKATEDAWRWDDNSAYGGYTNWELGEPNNNGAGEDCAVLYFGGDKKWNDVPCNLEYFGICQTTGRLVQYKCPPGTCDTSPAHLPGCICEECPAGHYCLGGDNDKKECEKGTFQPLTGQSACDPSPKGHKVPNTGAEHPTACPAGEFQNEQGQDSCKPCLKGHFCPGLANENPTKCPAGEFQDEPGKDSCHYCPKGHKCPGEGNAEPTACWNGQFQNQENKEVCKDCLEGHKCPGMGTIHPDECERNTFQPCTGQEKCIPCEAPKGSGVGATTCMTPE